MGVFIGVLAFAAVIGLAWYTSRMAERNDRNNLSDVGLAIVEFGRAFPNEALRSLHSTVDGQAVFVRLHDNRAGFMRHLRHHYACLLLEPGRVTVQPLERGHGFRVTFLDAPQHNGDYRFASAAEAAEVSLWLLGNFVAARDTAENGSSTDVSPPGGS